MIVVAWRKIEEKSRKELCGRETHQTGDGVYRVIPYNNREALVMRNGLDKEYDVAFSTRKVFSFETTIYVRAPTILSHQVENQKYNGPLIHEKTTSAWTREELAQCTAPELSQAILRGYSFPYSLWGKREEKEKRCTLTL